MKRSCLTFCALAIWLSLSCRPAAKRIEEAIVQFPKISAWEYRPDEAAGSVNVLIAAGREAACAALKRVGHKKWVSTDFELNQKVCHICRLVFLPHAGGEPLRAARLGAPELLPFHLLQDEEWASDWPFMPFALVQEVPLSMTEGYTGAGVPEFADEYVAYCMSNGTFRTRSFPIPTFTTASNALHEVLGSPAWKALKWKASGVNNWEESEAFAKQALWKQVENMAKLHRAGP